MPDNWREQLDWAIDEAFPRMVAVRRQLHAHPEPSGEEHHTSMYLYRLLDEEGFQVRIGPDGRGVLVDPPDDAGIRGRRIVARADIDALRIEDGKPVDYRSRIPGVMHACGHDGHTATVLGALLGLKALRESGVGPWPVCWRGIFQPAEETSRGAKEMIAAGALEDADGIFSLHVDPARVVGKIGLRVGALTASCDDMKIGILGRGGHAARPHESIDPIAAAAQLISSIYLFVPRATDSRDPVVVTIGQISGGDNPNVIPERVTLHGTLRTLGGETRARTKSHIRQLARGLAEASGASIELEFEDGPPSVLNDPAMTEYLRRAASDLLGDEPIDEIELASMGGEDFAYYLQRVPGSMFRLGCAPSSGGAAPLHSPLFDIDEECMRIGAKTLARAMVLYAEE